MRPFAYHEPASVEGCIDLLAQHGDDAHVMAGGTALMLLLTQGLISPGHVVSLRRLEALRELSVQADGSLVVGALVNLRQLERFPAAVAGWPALVDAVRSVATVRIRNQATLGGNLAHADPAQDPPTALLALDAELVVQGADGVRTLPIDGFFRDVFETALDAAEVLTAIHVPPLRPGTGQAYRKFLPGSHDDYATVSAFASLRIDDAGTLRHVRVALGAVGPTALRGRAVEAALEGQKPTAALLDEASALVRDEVDPFDDLRGSAAYKREMARVWTRRALEGALASAAASMGASTATDAPRGGASR